MDILQTNNTILVSNPMLIDFKYVYSLIKITTEDEELISSSVVISETSFLLTEDGHYKIVSAWITTIPGSGYYISGDTVYNSLNQPLTVEELLALDPSGTNISWEEEHYISTYYINEYYIDLLNSKFVKQLKCGCEFISKSDKIMIDTLTMGLTLIEKLIENSLYYEAGRILEKLLICARLVNPPNCNCNG